MTVIELLYKTQPITCRYSSLCQSIFRNCNLLFVYLLNTLALGPFPPPLLFSPPLLPSSAIMLSDTLSLFPYLNHQNY